MKRSLFYLAAGALALSACTSEEVLYEGIQSNAIGFKNVVDKQSRDANAVDITAANLNLFSVFGYYLNPNNTTQGVLVFNNEPVRKTTNADNQTVWTYDNTRYWVPGATYYFYAYSCGDIKLNSVYGSFEMDVNQNMESERALKINDYVCDATHQHDLLFASKSITPATDESGKVVASTDVAFKFSHILSKIETKFESDFAPEYLVEIKNVRASNIYNVGDYAPGKDWLVQDRKNINGNDPYVIVHGSTPILAQKGGTINHVDGTSETITELVAESESAFVIPHTYTSAEVSLSFEIVVKTKDVNGDYQVILGRTLSGSWKPTWVTGHWYTYTIKITGDAANLTPIMFTTETDPITGWSTGETPSDIQFSAN